MNKGARLSEFLLSVNNLELARLILSLSEGCKMIARMVNNAGLNEILGLTSAINVQGETVHKLDDISNQILMDYLKASESCAGYLSEENEQIMTITKDGLYTVSVDPLDGSSNVDGCAPIGTIFSVNTRLSKKGEPVTENDFLQQGTSTQCAGYVIYGSSTVLVFSTGNGVNGFTLSTTDSEFYLSHPDMKIPEEGKIYSINQGNAGKFSEEVSQFIAYSTGIDKTSSRPYTLRYIGSMVADLHRNLIKGGIFIYPANKGETKGKLRLLYECIPMSYVTEQAGGRATDGKQRLLEVQPVEIHERSAIFIGSKRMVDKAMEFLN